MIANMMTGCSSTKAAAENKSVSFDFNESDSGFIPIFADYPNGNDAEEFFEFKHEYGKVPIDGAGNGIFISGNNHSSDLFMGYVKMVAGFNPGAYEFKEFHAEIDTAANENGEVYLIISTDSGFEATTSYYLDDIFVRWGED